MKNLYIFLMFAACCVGSAQAADQEQDKALLFGQADAARVVTIYSLFSCNACSELFQRLQKAERTPGSALHAALAGGDLAVRVRLRHSDQKEFWAELYARCAKDPIEATRWMFLTSQMWNRATFKTAISTKSIRIENSTGQFVMKEVLVPDQMSADTFDTCGQDRVAAAALHEGLKADLKIAPKSTQVPVVEIDGKVFTGRDTIYKALQALVAEN